MLVSHGKMFHFSTVSFTMHLNLSTELMLTGISCCHCWCLCAYILHEIHAACLHMWHFLCCDIRYFSLIRCQCICFLNYNHCASVIDMAEVAVSVFICHIFIDVGKKLCCCRLFVCIDANKTKTTSTTPALSMLDCISLHYQVYHQCAAIINIIITSVYFIQHAKFPSLLLLFFPSFFLIYIPFSHIQYSIWVLRPNSL